MNLSVSKTDDLAERVRALAGASAGRPAAEGRQPVHTVFVPADRFSRTTTADWGAQALRLLNKHTPGDGSFGASFMLDPTLAGQIRARVAAKLSREPIEDLRVDFASSYGDRPDAEEDEHVEQVVEAVATSYNAQQLPHFWGVRVKSFSGGGHVRAMRTLDGFLTSLRDRLGRLPGGFTITLPGVTAAEQVAVFTDFLDRLEAALGLPNGTLRFEVQIDAPEGIADQRGGLGVRRVLVSGQGRIQTVHFGGLDYAAALGLPEEQRRLDHPVCDFARHVLQTTTAGWGVRLSDGPPHLTPRDDTADEVVPAWQAHATEVRHSLAHGFYQGWDTDPAHLPARYAALFDFHLSGVEAAIGRLNAAPEKSPALLDRLQRGVACGALDPEILQG
ncbi:aldolase/citrate lyase family protein [Actinocorallia aurea]